VVEADAPKALWAQEFQFDCTIGGKAIKIAPVDDEYPRVSLLHVVDRSIAAERLVTELERVFATACGPPRMPHRQHTELDTIALQHFCDGGVGSSCTPPRRTTEQRLTSKRSTTATKGCLTATAVDADDTLVEYVRGKPSRRNSGTVTSDSESPGDDGEILTLETRMESCPTNICQGKATSGRYSGAVTYRRIVPS
jgi:hypothetical protein